MHILIVDNNTSYIHSLEKIIYPNKFSVIKWDKLKYSKVEDYDLIILSGGHPNSVQSHHQLYEEETKTILRSDIPILGICFGFELIVYAFGGKLKELPQKEKGILEIRTIKEDKVLEDIKKIIVFESHRWVAETLPQDLIALAESENGIEIFKHITRFMYGFQFHPEIITGEEDVRVFKNLLKLASK